MSEPGGGAGEARERPQGDGAAGVPVTTDGTAGVPVTTGALARRLGVSPTTLRTWDRRYGLGPTRREPGRHRRWSERDIAVVEEMGRLTSLGVPPSDAARTALTRGSEARAGSGAGAGSGSGSGPAPGAGPGPLVRQRRGLSRAAVRLDAPAVQDLLADAVARHGLVAAWQEIMVPTLHAVGRKWEEAGDRYVEVEHLLSWQVSRTLH
ncbi:MerR family transcriptional regulator, partial [Streptomyces sp. BG9H]